MRKFKRTVSLLVVAMMSVAMVWGCGNSSDNTSDTTNDAEEKNADNQETESSEPVEITIWHEVTDEIANVIQTELDQLAPEIVVNFERKEQLGDALKLVGNDPAAAPDMYFYAHDKVGTYAAMEILDPITNYLSEDDLSQMLPMTLEAGTYKDEMYQLPLYYEVQLFMYNKELMSDEDVPATTDDLLAYMKENTGDGSYGYVEQHTNAYTVSSWIHAYGAEIINEDAVPALDSQEMIDALTYHKEFVPYMPADGEYNTVTTLFLEGNAHSIVSGPWLVPEIKEAGIDLGIAALPTANATGAELAPYSGVKGVCVLKVAEDKSDAVTAVLKQLMNTDFGIELADLANCAPAKEECYESEAVSENEMVTAMLEAAETAVPMPCIPEMDLMWAVSEGMLASINKNDADVAETCESAQQDALTQIEAMQ